MYQYESGDYYNENDSRIEEQAYRLQSYVQTLRDKLEREKASLYYLKSETELLLAERGLQGGTMGGHLPECPLARQRTCARQAVDVERRQGYGHQTWRPTVAQQPRTQPPQRPPSPYRPPPPHPPTPCDRRAILNKLAQIDNMCKQEMLRINQVASELEPFKQLANDWNFQAEIAKRLAAGGHAERVDPDTNEIPEKDQNCGPVQRHVKEEDFAVVKQTTEVHFNGSHSINTRFDFHESETNEIFNPAEENENVSRETSSRPPAHKEEEVKQQAFCHMQETEEKQKEAPAEVVCREKEDLDKKAEDRPSEGPTRRSGRRGGDKKDPVAPISWRRLVVDKKKRRLASRPGWDCSSQASSSTSEDSSGEEGRTAKDKSFLQKYMYSDSEYVYSPLFVTESDETG